MHPCHIHLSLWGALKPASLLRGSPTLKTENWMCSASQLQAASRWGAVNSQFSSPLLVQLQWLRKPMQPLKKAAVTAS
jgi:hypothetical protein